MFSNYEKLEFFKHTKSILCNIVEANNVFSLYFFEVYLLQILLFVCKIHTHLCTALIQNKQNIHILLLS